MYSKVKSEMLSQTRVFQLFERLGKLDPSQFGKNSQLWLVDLDSKDRLECHLNPLEMWTSSK